MGGFLGWTQKRSTSSPSYRQNVSILHTCVCVYKQKSAERNYHIHNIKTHFRIYARFLLTHTQNKNELTMGGTGALMQYYVRIWWKGKELFRWEFHYFRVFKNTHNVLFFFANALRHVLVRSHAGIYGKINEIDEQQ